MNELIHYGGRPVMLARFGVGDDTSVGDLLAYRQEWEPFIKAHVDLWRKVNSLLESIPAAQQCPSGISRTATDYEKLDPTMQSYCWDLTISRWAISDTDPAGIPHMWNAWAGKSSADIYAGAGSMLKWLQQTVTTVGGPYKDDLLNIAKRWNIPVDLPPVPSLSLQQQIIARIEGAWISLKGILQIVGYGTGQMLETAGNLVDATAKGLTDVAKVLPKVLGSSWTWIGMTAAFALVGAGLVIYYVPRRRTA